MSCPELSESLLWEYVDEELPAAQAGDVERHIMKCSWCAARLEEMRRRPLASGPQPMAMPPPYFRARVMARVSVEAALDRQRSALGWLAPLWQPGRLAAVSTAALTFGLLSAIAVGAMLAVPVVEAVAPTPDAPVANSMLRAMQQGLSPLRPFFQDWAWFVLLLGMVAVILMPGMRLLTVRYPGRA